MSFRSFYKRGMDVSGRDNIVDFHSAYPKIMGTDTMDMIASQTIPLCNLRTWDAPGSPIPATAGNDDLGLVAGTLGTNAHTAQTGDVKAAGCTRYAGIYIPITFTGADVTSVAIVANAGMVTTVSDGVATLDVEAYRQAAPTVDICATAAQSIKSLTAADKSFTLTKTNLVPGDILYVRFKIAIVDAATGTAVIGIINSIKLDVS